MASLFTYFYLFVIFGIALAIWSVYDQWRFTRFDGPMKRGMMVDAAPLTWEMRQFLELMPPAMHFDGNFIRKEITEVLIGEEKSFGERLFTRRNRFRYVAYVNLSASEGQIEFRTPISALFSLVVALGVIIFIFLQIFLLPTRGLGAPTIIWIFPFVFLAILVGSTLFNHYQERRRLLGVLSRAMGRLAYKS